MPWRLPAATLALVVTLLCGIGAVRAEPDALPDGRTPATHEVDASGDAGWVRLSDAWRKQTVRREMLSETLFSYSFS